MEKRYRPPKGFYSSLGDTLLPRSKCDPKTVVVETYTAERIVAKKSKNWKVEFMVKWHDYCASQNTWEPPSHLSEALLEHFNNPSPDPVHVEEARERIGLAFEKEMKIPLQYTETLQMRHDLVRFLFPGLPQDLQTKAHELSDQELLDAGLGSYMERTITVTGSKCRVIQPSIRLLLGKSPAFFSGSFKISRPVECVCIIFRKSYEAGDNF